MEECIYINTVSSVVLIESGKGGGGCGVVAVSSLPGVVVLIACDQSWVRVRTDISDDTQSVHMTFISLVYVLLLG